jgi:acetyl coenzyme A synthetase (ADP forming)-like protein
MEESRHPLDAIFRPRSVAVVGTSRDKASLGREILSNILSYEFEGVVFPVNPKAKVVSSLKCYPSVSAIPDPVDLAVVVVPRDSVFEVVEDAAKKGVRGMVIVTAGFKEVGGVGVEMERRLCEMAREAGMRFVGPNCMGIVNTEEEVRLEASFGTTAPIPGNVSFVSQSGALGEAILATTRQLGIGIHMFASVGNKADITSNDLLAYWEDDPRTGVILLYLESFGTPRKFTALARRVTRKKPIVAVKSGRTSAGQRAARSHTGALAESLDVTADTLFEQTGILRVNTLEEMFHVASALSNQPLPEGPRVGIITNAGGPGILATDACVNLGLDVPPLAEETEQALRRILAEEASVANPVDMIATGSPESFFQGIRLMLADPNVNSLIVIYTCVANTDDVAVATGVAEAVCGSRKPVVSCFMGRRFAQEAVRILKGRRIPVYDFPEEPALALAAMDRYRRYRERPEGQVVRFEVELERARAIVRRAQEEGRDGLKASEARELLEAYSIPTVEQRVVSQLGEAVEATKAIGFPVALKLAGEGIEHKTDMGGVALDLRDMDEVVNAWEGMQERFPGKSFLVQRMLRGGREVALGVVQDPSFGPLLMFGLGGIHVEYLKDVAFRIHPLTDLDAQDMVRAIRAYRLLQGVRGAEPVDEEFLVECILRLSQLVGDLPEVEELEMNPFMICPTREASAAVDIRVHIRPPAEKDEGGK